MRYEVVKKRLWKESIIVGVAVAVLGGGAYFLTDMYDENERNSKTLETQVNSIVAAMNTLKEKFSSVQKNADLYQDVLRKNASNGLSISRELIRAKFDQFKNAYYLSSLRLSMEPAVDLTGANYKLGTGVMNYSSIKTTFFALTDEDIFSLLPAIQQNLTGAVKFTRISLIRKNQPNDENLKSIKQSGAAQMMEGTVEYYWMGIKQTESNNPGTALLNSPEGLPNPARKIP